MSATFQTRLGKDAVTIRRIIRRMAGCSQSRLVQCEDSLWYVAKFLGNPQGNRSLVNEFICSKLISTIGVSTPQIRFLYLPASLLRASPISFQVGNEFTSPEGDLHLGSQLPVNPEKVAIFDLMPRKLLPKVENVTDFATMFVIDRWLDNSDLRQAIFFRSAAGILQASFIDHGKCLGGSSWEFQDVGTRDLIYSKSIYELVDMKSLTRCAVDKIQAVSAEQFEAFAMQVPTAWLAPHDQDHLGALIAELQNRQARLSDLMRPHLEQLGLG